MRQKTNNDVKKKETISRKLVQTVVFQDKNVCSKKTTETAKSQSIDGSEAQGTSDVAPAPKARDVEGAAALAAKRAKNRLAEVKKARERKEQEKKRQQSFRDAAITTAKGQWRKLQAIKAMKPRPRGIESKARETWTELPKVYPNGLIISPAKGGGDRNGIRGSIPLGSTVFVDGKGKVSGILYLQAPFFILLYPLTTCTLN